MEITTQSKLLDVLEAYPELEPQIIRIAPPFKNLKNPVLRRTVGKLANLEQVARIGGMDASRLVNTLRRAVGMEELGEEELAPLVVDLPMAVDDPEWMVGKPQFTLDGTALLKHGEVPLGKVNELLGQLIPGGFILLVTDFEPSPILEAMAKQNRRVYHKVNPAKEGQHLTYIQCQARNTTEATMYDTFSSEYDRFVNWQNRLGVEMPFLEKILHEAGVHRVLDSACGTGMHAIALAQTGFQAVGADFSAGMVAQALKNAGEAKVEVPFEQAGFGELEKTFGGKGFDALLCLGNSLPNVSGREELLSTLADFAACLKPGGLLMLQNRNFDAVMENKLRWMEPQAAREGGEEWIFLRFYDFDPDGRINFHILSLHRIGGGEWQQTIRSTRLFPLLYEPLTEALKQKGFEEIRYYGDMNGNPFDEHGSGNLVVAARLGR